MTVCGLVFCVCLTVKEEIITLNRSVIIVLINFSIQGPLLPFTEWVLINIFH